MLLPPVSVTEDLHPPVRINIFQPKKGTYDVDIGNAKKGHRDLVGQWVDRFHEILQTVSWTALKQVSKMFCFFSN